MPLYYTRFIIFSSAAVRYILFQKQCADLKAESHSEAVESMQPESVISPKSRNYIIIASLLALFLGALDALVMSAAMPTIVADLSGLHLYSWVYSAYLLARAVSLPVFGKLADIFRSRRLYIISICIFLVGSIFAGLAQSMTQLILSREFQIFVALNNECFPYISLQSH